MAQPSTSPPGPIQPFIYTIHAFSEPGAGAWSFEATFAGVRSDVLGPGVQSEIADSLAMYIAQRIFDVDYANDFQNDDGANLRRAARVAVSRSSYVGRSTPVLLLDVGPRPAQPPPQA
jgi:hypothetical protein